MTRIVAAIALLLMSGCELLGPCEGDIRAGIALHILDRETGAAVLADSIFVWARDGAYADSARFSNAGPDPTTTDIPLTWERPGVYDLSVVATGYQLWTRDNVRVRAGRCHVEPVN